MLLPRKPHTFRDRFLRVTRAMRSRYVDNGFVSQKFSPRACSPRFTGGEPLTSDIELLTTDHGPQTSDHGPRTRNKPSNPKLCARPAKLRRFFPFFRPDTMGIIVGIGRLGMRGKGVACRAMMVDVIEPLAAAQSARADGTGLVFAGDGDALGQTIEAWPGSLAPSSQSMATAGEEIAVAGRLHVAEPVLGFNFASFSEFR
jgi:hypothetical protein